MYKTIRHGENSLQYTILPQNDDFRIDGKLTSAESSCSNVNSNGRKSKTKRPRRRSFFAYLGLIFVCTVIVGAVLIPFLVSTECLPNPTKWFMGKQIEKHEKTASPLKNHGNLGFNNLHGSFIGNSINIGKTVKIINQSGVEKIILRVNKTSNATENEKILPNINQKSNSNLTLLKQNSNNIIQTQQNIVNGNAIVSSTITLEPEIKNENEIEMEAQKNAQKTQEMNDQAQRVIENSNIQSMDNKNLPTEHFVTEVRFEPAESVSSMPPGIIPTIVVTTLRNQLTNNEATFQQSEQQEPEQQLPQLQAQTAPNMRPTTSFSTSALSQSNNVNLISQNSTLMTRIIQVPLLKAAAKKPIVPPTLIKTNSQLSTTNGIEISRNGNPAIITTSSPQSPDVPSLISELNTGTGPIVKPAKATDWMHGHWPFIDPSTYFQWGGYKDEDSVLLPALLGFALIGIILIITVCLVARNKRTIVSSVRRRNRNVSDIEENGAEDNTTLLTTSNLSDED